MSKAKVVVLGNRNTCGYCKTFGSLTNSTKTLTTLLPNAEVIDADGGSNMTLFNYWLKKSKATGKMPVILVYDENEVLKGKFVGRKTDVSPWTVERMVEMINEICPNCFQPENPDTEPNTDENICTCSHKEIYCQTCGKKIKRIL